ncbi:MAG TPA: hypothetical protein VKA68_10330 [bacterium]|nr:hypothetical protein [bacterium]
MASAGKIAVRTTAAYILLVSTLQAAASPGHAQGAHCQVTRASPRSHTVSK